MSLARCFVNLFHVLMSDVIKLCVGFYLPVPKTEIAPRWTFIGSPLLAALPALLITSMLLLFAVPFNILFLLPYVGSFIHRR